MKDVRRIPADRYASAWDELKARVEACDRCGLCAARTRTVFGQGAVRTPLVFVGEGPGADEDREGLAFVGKAGQLLTQEEMLRCGDYLEAQLLLLRPRLLVCLGNTPMRWILKTTEGITALRGRWFEWRGIEVMPMFHPSYLLRNDSRQKGSPKDLTWQDVQKLKARLDVIRKENAEVA